TRNYIAALDASTGLAAAWNPSANGPVYALAVSDATIYVGGDFSIIGGQTRNYIAALDSSGAATAWNPNATWTVYALAVSGTTVYAGGSFETIGGEARKRIAALDSSGAATAWNPNADWGVYALAVSGTTVYAGGYFSTIGGRRRNHIAAIDSSGAATAWDPNADWTVYALAISGTTVYTGGSFTSIGGQARNHIAALDANSTGTATAWNPNALGTVISLAVSGSTVYAGGGFTSIGGLPRNRIAALDASGAPTDWNPDADHSIYALAVSGTMVYAGGCFTSIGGQPRNLIAALDANSTGTTTAWNPNATGYGYTSSVTALAVSGTTVYVGGRFDWIGGKRRYSIAALDANSTGVATAWDAMAYKKGDFYGAHIYALAVSGSTVYAGGEFSFIGGKMRNNIAALDAATGAATAWNPYADGIVRALALSGETIYAGGEFHYIGGQTRYCIAALDVATSNATEWRPGGHSFDVHALAVAGTTVYAGGSFDAIGGEARNYIAGLDARTGFATEWNPEVGDWVRALATSSSIVYIGGGRAGFAQFDPATTTVPVDVTGYYRITYKREGKGTGEDVMGRVENGTLRLLENTTENDTLDIAWDPLLPTSQRANAPSLKRVETTGGFKKFMTVAKIESVLAIKSIAALTASGTYVGVVSSLCGGVRTVNMTWVNPAKPATTRIIAGGVTKGKTGKPLLGRVQLSGVRLANLYAPNQPFSLVNVSAKKVDDGAGNVGIVTADSLEIGWWITKIVSLKLNAAMIEYGDLAGVIRKIVGQGAFFTLKREHGIEKVACPADMTMGWFTTSAPNVDIHLAGGLIDCVEISASGAISRLTSTAKRARDVNGKILRMGGGIGCWYAKAGTGHTWSDDPCRLSDIGTLFATYAIIGDFYAGPEYKGVVKYMDTGPSGIAIGRIYMSRRRGLGKFPYPRQNGVYRPHGDFSSMEIGYGEVIEKVQSSDRAGDGPIQPVAPEALRIANQLEEKLMKARRVGDKVRIYGDKPKPKPPKPLPSGNTITEQFNDQQ
ncbi:MAG: hypothetical protein NTX50_19160, partial [Candidatus Sumerlaeota bacterium]|nr:hypothetical protein [Candidatus Sumerlaeota bacterium]